MDKETTLFADGRLYNNNSNIFTVLLDNPKLELHITRYQNSKKKKKKGRKHVSLTHINNLKDT